MKKKKPVQKKIVKQKLCKHKWIERFEDCMFCGGDTYWECDKCFECRSDKKDKSSVIC